MMTYCIVVADGARARIFTAVAPSGRGARLEERQVLVNPERNLALREEFSSQSGGNRAPPRGASHAYDDHRARHRDELERRFARRIAAAAARLIRRETPGWFVVVAEPRLLGMLRAPLDAALPPSVPRTELSGDLSWHALPHIRELLERRGVLPESTPSPRAWRPRVQPPPKRAARIEPPRARVGVAGVERQTKRPRRGRTKMR